MPDHKRWINLGDRQGKRVGAPDDTDRAQRTSPEDRERQRARDRVEPSKRPTKKSTRTARG